MRMLEPVHGMPASDHGENVDSAASYATWPNSLTVRFVRGEFAGWSVSPANSTADREPLKLGSTREEPDCRA